MRNRQTWRDMDWFDWSGSNTLQKQTKVHVQFVKMILYILQYSRIQRIPALRIGPIMKNYVKGPTLSQSLQKWSWWRRPRSSLITGIRSSTLQYSLIRYVIVPLYRKGCGILSMKHNLRGGAVVQDSCVVMLLDSQLNGPVIEWMCTIDPYLLIHSLITCPLKNKRIKLYDKILCSMTKWCVLTNPQDRRPTYLGWEFSSYILSLASLNRLIVCLILLVKFSITTRKYSFSPRTSILPS